MELLHTEVYDVLHNLEKSIITDDDSTKTSIQRQIVEMKDLLNVERNEYEVEPHCPSVLFCFVCLSCVHPL
jgi:1-phosphatidylinositol-3-phosphate 5-kinase